MQARALPCTHTLPGVPLMQAGGADRCLGDWHVLTTQSLEFTIFIKSGIQGHQIHSPLFIAIPTIWF